MKGRHYNIHWSEDVEDFLLLLKLIPSKQAGKSTVATVENFNKASDMFITFELVSIKQIYNEEIYINCYDLFHLEIHTTHRNGKKFKKSPYHHCLRRRFEDENRILLLED